MIFQRLMNLIGNIYAMETLDLNVIKFLWNECHIPIYQIGECFQGAFVFSKTLKTPRIIEIGLSSTKMDTMTTLLHEVGHYKDFMDNRELFLKRCKTKQNKVLEKTAWKHAMRFSEKYNIPINYKEAKESLKTYNAEYACLNNKVKNEAV